MFSLKGIKEVRGRQNDPFLKEVSKIMGLIEMHMRRVPGKCNPIANVEHFSGYLSL